MKPTIYLDGEQIDDFFKLELVNESQDVIENIHINSKSSFNLIEDGVFNLKTSIDTYNASFGMYISFIFSDTMIDKDIANQFAEKKITLLLEFLEEVENITEYKINGEILKTQYDEGKEYGGFAQSDFEGYRIKLNEEGNFDSVFPYEDSLGKIVSGLDESNLFYTIKTEDGVDVSNLFRFRCEYKMSSGESDYEYISCGEYLYLENNYDVYMEYSYDFNNEEAKSKLLGKTIQIEFIFTSSDVVEI